MRLKDINYDKNIRGEMTQDAYDEIKADCDLQYEIDKDKKA